MVGVRKAVRLLRHAAFHANETANPHQVPPRCSAPLGVAAPREAPRVCSCLASRGLCRTASADHPRSGEATFPRATCISRPVGMLRCPRCAGRSLLSPGRRQGSARPQAPCSARCRPGPQVITDPKLVPQVLVHLEHCLRVLRRRSRRRVRSKPRRSPHRGSAWARPTTSGKGTAGIATSSLVTTLPNAKLAFLVPFMARGSCQTNPSGH